MDLWHLLFSFGVTVAGCYLICRAVNCPGGPARALGTALVLSWAVLLVGLLVQLEERAGHGAYYLLLFAAPVATLLSLLSGGVILRRRCRAGWLALSGVVALLLLGQWLLGWPTLFRDYYAQQFNCLLARTTPGAGSRTTGWENYCNEPDGARISLVNYRLDLPAGCRIVRGRRLADYRGIAVPGYELVIGANLNQTELVALFKRQLERHGYQQLAARDPAGPELLFGCEPYYVVVSSTVGEAARPAKCHPPAAVQLTLLEDDASRSLGYLLEADPGGR